MTIVDDIAVEVRTLHPAPLDRLIALEDRAELEGLLSADNRTTCHSCRSWATPEHTASEAHWELLQVICQAQVPHGVLDGMCFLPLPCPDHPAAEGAEREPADAVAADRLRRLDRRLAAVIGTGAIAALGYTTGRQMRPWAGGVPDELVWALTGALVAIIPVYAAVMLLLRWVDGRPYAANRLLNLDELAPAPAGGGVPDGR